MKKISRFAIGLVAITAFSSSFISLAHAQYYDAFGKEYATQEEASIADCEGQQGGVWSVSDKSCFVGSSSGTSPAPSPDPGIPLNESGVPYTQAQIDAANNASPGLKTLGGGLVNMTYLEGYKKSIVDIINTILVPVLMAIAFIVFLWGVYKYFIYGASNEGEKAEGRKFALWGVIGFVIILSLWGLVNIVRDTLNFNQAGSNVPAYPTL